MSRRTWLMLMIVTGAVFGLGAVKVLQIQAAIAQASSFQPPPEAVTTILARSETWPTTISAIGTARAVRGVRLSADLPGVVEALSVRFRTSRPGGRAARAARHAPGAGAARGRRGAERARAREPRARARPGEPAESSPRPSSTASSAEHKQAEARVGEIRATIERKQIRAPFSGVLGIRQVDLGQYLNAGDEVVSLQATHPIYVDFSVPQQQLAEVRVGREVRVSAAGQGGQEMPGRITAVDSVVDEATRNVQVQATLANPKGELRPGMFVETRVVTGEGGSAVVLPASAISYAPYGDSVFVVSDAAAERGQAGKVVTQQFVKLGNTRGDQVAVVSGIAAGAEVVSSGAFKLRNGAAVRVNNEVQPANDPRPRPRTTDACHGRLRSPPGARGRRQPRDPDRGAVGGPLAERAPVPAQRHRGRPCLDRLHRGQRRAGARLHHDAARAGDRERRRHRLPRVLERVEPEHDHGAPQAQLRHERRAHPDPGQGGAGAQRPAAEAEAPIIELETADSQFAAMYVGFASDELDQNQITDYLTRVVQPRLSAISGVQRADILGDRTFAMRIWLKPDRMAALEISPSEVHDALARNNYLSALGRTKGSMVSVESGREHGPEDAGGVPAAGGEAEGRGPGAARRDRGRRARRRELRRGRPLRRPDRHLHGHLGAALGQLARGDRPGARGDEGCGGAAAGGNAGRHSLRRDRVHPGRDRRGVEDAQRDAADRDRGDLPVPRVVEGSADPGRGHPDLAGRSRVPDARRRLHHQPADAARDRALGRPGGGRRDRDGGERRAPPADGLDRRFWPRATPHASWWGPSSR